MKLLFFAQCAQWCGRRELELRLGAPEPLSRLLHAVPELRGVLERRAQLRVAVNREFASFDEVVHDDDEIAFLPPVSGG